MRTHSLIPVVLAAAAALAACGSSSSTHNTAAPDAWAVTAQLQKAGLPIPHGVNIYTAATDPNHLLGRPGEYTSAAEWPDLRYPLTAAADVGVEVFPSASLATRRAAYVQSLMGGILGTEYDYLAGPVLVRVAGVLTPAQAAQYGAAIGGKLYTAR